MGSLNGFDVGDKIAVEKCDGNKSNYIIQRVKGLIKGGSLIHLFVGKTVFVIFPMRLDFLKSFVASGTTKCRINV